MKSVKGEHRERERERGAVDEISCMHSVFCASALDLRGFIGMW